jgi:hypothetical protein
MVILLAVPAAGLILVVLLDAFETIVLPRRVTRPAQFARWFYRAIWALWSVRARRVPARPGRNARRETWLSIYGPFALLVLLGTWAVGLIVGFGLLQFAVGSQISSSLNPPDFWTDLYLSGTTVFTLGLGDVVPTSTTAQVLVVIEAGLGFAFLALIISYLPVLYQSFSRREVSISMLDERAGSPPSGTELLRRGYRRGQFSRAETFLEEWERWSAELMETHLSYPLLAYFRSQHENQSWVAALTTILDSCALSIVGIEGISAERVRLTFAMARHCAVDLSQVLGTPPQWDIEDRLPPERLAELRAQLDAEGVVYGRGPEADALLIELRQAYEPYVCSLSDHLLMPLPEWFQPKVLDNWESTAWSGPRTVV